MNVKYSLTEYGLIDIINYNFLSSFVICAKWFITFIYTYFYIYFKFDQYNHDTILIKEITFYYSVILHIIYYSINKIQNVSHKIRFFINVPVDTATINVQIFF